LHSGQLSIDSNEPLTVDYDLDFHVVDGGE